MLVQLIKQLFICKNWTKRHNCKREACKLLQYNLDDNYLIYWKKSNQTHDVSYQYVGLVNVFEFGLVLFNVWVTEFLSTTKHGQNCHVWGCIRYLTIFVTPTIVKENISFKNLVSQIIAFTLT